MGCQLTVAEFKIVQTYTSGNWPSQVALSPTLRYAMIAHNFDEISGPLPRGLSDMPNLYSFDMQGPGQKFTGTIPPLPQTLEVFNVLDNLLTGITPDLINMPKLQLLEVSGNRLTGLGNVHDCPELQVVRARDNEISGGFPSFSNLPKLLELNLPGNDMTGTLPPSLSELTALTRLDVARNKLTSPLPGIGAHLVHLEYVDISSNQFSDLCDADLFFKFLPETTRNATTGSVVRTCDGNVAAPLKHAHFANNQITGACNLRFDYFPNLKTFDAANNKLSGSALPSFWTPTGGPNFKAAFVTIDISGNNYQGQIGATTGNSAGLPSVSTINFESTELLGRECEWGTFSRAHLSKDKWCNCSAPQKACNKVAPCCRQLPYKFLKQEEDGAGGFKSYEKKAGTNFECPRIIGTDNVRFTTTRLDPKYYAWDNCRCDRGLVGMPPDCAPPAEVIKVTDSKATLEDEIGSVRLRKGSSIKWTLAPDAWTKETCADEVDKQMQLDVSSIKSSKDSYALDEIYFNLTQRQLDANEPSGSPKNISTKCSKKISACAEFQKQSELRECRKAFGDSDGCTTEQCCKSEQCRACEKLSKCLPCRNSTKEELGMCDDDNDGIENSEDLDTPVDRGGLNSTLNSTLSLQERLCSCPVRMISINILRLMNPSENGVGDEENTSTKLTVRAGDSEIDDEVFTAKRSQENCGEEKCDFLKWRGEEAVDFPKSAPGFRMVGTQDTGTAGRVLVEFETSSEESSKHFIRFDYLSDPFCPEEWEPWNVLARNDSVQKGCLETNDCDWDYGCKYTPFVPVCGCQHDESQLTVLSKENGGVLWNDKYYDPKSFVKGGEFYDASRPECDERNGCCESPIGTAAEGPQSETGDVPSHEICRRYVIGGGYNSHRKGNMPAELSLDTLQWKNSQFVSCAGKKGYQDEIGQKECKACPENSARNTVRVFCTQSLHIFTMPAVCVLQMCCTLSMRAPCMFRACCTHTAHAHVATCTQYGCNKYIMPCTMFVVYMQ